MLSKVVLLCDICEYTIHRVVRDSFFVEAISFNPRLSIIYVCKNEQLCNSSIPETGSSGGSYGLVPLYAPLLLSQSKWMADDCTQSFEMHKSLKLRDWSYQTLRCAQTSIRRALIEVIIGLNAQFACTINPRVCEKTIIRIDNRHSKSWPSNLETW